MFDEMPLGYPSVVRLSPSFLRKFYLCETHKVLMLMSMYVMNYVGVEFFFASGKLVSSSSF